MKDFRKNSVIALLGLLTVALVAFVSMSGLRQATVANAASVEVQAAAKTAQAAPNAGFGKHQELLDSFTKSFAGKLGVDEAKLNSAFSGAVSDTADEAVKGGQISQEQANFIKEQTKNGFKGLLDVSKFNFPIGAHKDASKGGWKGANEFGQYLMPLVTEVSKALKLSPMEIMQQVQAGKSLADIAKAQNVDVQDVKTAITNAVKTQLDAAVKDGKVSQAHADKAAQTLAIWLDEGLNLSVSNLPNKGKFDQAELEAYATPVLNATASALNLTPDQLKTQLHSGKSLGEIAKAQNVELAKVKTALLDSVKAQLDVAAKAGKATQAQADKAYQTIVLWIDEAIK